MFICYLYWFYNLLVVCTDGICIDLIICWLFVRTLGFSKLDFSTCLTPTCGQTCFQNLIFNTFYQVSTGRRRVHLRRFPPKTVQHSPSTSFPIPMLSFSCWFLVVDLLFLVYLCYYVFICNSQEMFLMGYLFGICIDIIMF